jgi:hypothetical protein
LILLLAAQALAADLAGVVRDGDGAPLAGVAVYAIDERLAYAYAVSRSGGDWGLAGLPAGRYRLLTQPDDDSPYVTRVWPDAWAYCDGAVIEVAGDEAREGLDFTLPTGGTLSGAVLDEGGAPLAGVEISCLGVDTRVQGLRREAWSDSEGRFVITGLDGEAGGSAWSLEFEVDGWPEQLAGRTYDDGYADLFGVGPGLEVDAGEHRLLPGIAISGSVLGPDGPIPGASVHAYASSQVVDVVTDEQGRYAADGLPPGDVITWVNAEGYGLTYYPDADRPGETVPAPEEGDEVAGVDLEMPFASALLGRVVGADGDLSGVTVLAYNDTYTVGQGAQADEGGQFTVEGMQGGDYFLYVYAEDEGFLNDFIRDDDGEPEVFPVPDAAASAEFEIALAPAAVLEGLVLDDGGDPVYGAYVYAYSLDVDGEAEAVATDRDGVFRLDGLVGGGWGLEVFYSPYCEGDGGFVRVYWPGLVNPDLAQSLELTEGQVYQDLQFELPVDADRDEMGDRWEEGYGLDVGRDDSGEDPDGDGYTNLEEYRLGTDPTTITAEEGCGGGCRGGDQAGLLLLGLLGLRVRGRTSFPRALRRRRRQT